MINSDKVLQWKNDVIQSVDLYNNWFINYAPKAYRDTRIRTTKQVADSLEKLNYLLDINAKALFLNPNAISILRMCTVPPLARDRLTGLPIITIIIMLIPFWNQHLEKVRFCRR